MTRGVKGTVSTYPHGTRSRRQAGCECAPCVRANARYCKAYRVRIQRDPSSVGIDTARAAAHIAYLRDVGMSYNAIAAASGIADTTIKRMKHQRKTKPRVEAAILAVDVTTPAGTCYIPALGTTRRIQAMRAWGISQDEISRRTGIAKSSITQIVTGARPRVQSDTAERVRAMYDQVCMDPPVGLNKYERGAITRNKRIAARLGYAPPFAWDNIDDANERPDAGDHGPSDTVDQVVIDRLRDGHHVTVAPEDRALVIDELASKGMADPEIGRGIGVSTKTVLRIRQECGIPSGVPRSGAAA